jgi:hypothetical protein
VVVEKLEHMAGRFPWLQSVDRLQPRGASARTIRAFHSTTSAMRIVYHVTPPANIPSILQNGLLPQLGQRSAIAGETVPAVFCFVGLDEVESALVNWLGDYFDEAEPLSLLRVELAPNALLGEGAEYEVVVRSPIPALAVEVLLQDVWNEAGLTDNAVVSSPQP